ncbi:ATP-binding protein [Phenylobacterium deserti]|uniref:histidine kinase n=1 Tax=Phenylobacterium deserti TaxID=1914756 RepID=A0A328AN57_9CAUL|nr:ATP-binding protein [Phenylobacterium deserti]RAK56432.1 hybrid sensor histidine kinase/response regulator [Phenylobacterium deserti]
MRAAFPESEENRLKVLYSLDFIGSEPGRAFQDIVSLAAETTGCPLALFSVIDRDRQHFKAKVGTDLCENHRDAAFCAHTILEPGVLWVQDLLLDPRFSDSILVTGEPWLRFYAGAPVTVDGENVGALAIVDVQPRAFDAREARRLERLAGMAADAMVARREANLLRGVVERSPDAVITTDDSGGILRWNAAAERLFGYTSEEAVGRPLDMITPAHLRAQRASQISALATGNLLGEGTASIELLGLCKDGREIPMEASFSIQRLGGRFTMTAMLRDASERKAREKALSEAVVRAEAGERAKNEFLGNMSHEVRTPLNGIIGLAGALRRTDLKPEQKDMVGGIEASAGALSNLLKDVLDLARIDGEDVEIRPEPFHLGEMLTALSGFFGPGASAKGLAFDAAVDPECEGWVTGDPLRVRQILNKLLSNALKFTDVGGVTLRAQAGRPGEVLFVVQDTGVGFGPEAAGHLFERFNQADASDTRRFGGAGVGLALAQSLAKRMGGRIEATSSPGAGATFTLTLPLPASGRAAAAAPVAEPRSPAAHVRVLLAEDNAINRKVVEVILGAAEVEVVSVENGREALEAFKAADFDAILMDIQMPVMDGLSAIRAIREMEAQSRRPRTPIVVVSANVMSHDIARSHQAGADDHIGKPLTSDILFRAVSGAIAHGHVDMDGMTASYM